MVEVPNWATVKWLRYNTVKASTISNLVVSDQAMPYDHPLDQQGYIASVMHSGTAAYSSYIGLVASGISITTIVKNSDIHHHYFDIIGTVPGQDHHNIWDSLSFLAISLKHVPSLL